MIFSLFISVFVFFSVLFNSKILMVMMLMKELRRWGK